MKDEDMALDTARRVGRSNDYDGQRTERPPAGFLFASQVSTLDLVRLRRTHVFWLMISAGLGIVATVIPSSPWYAQVCRAALLLTCFLSGLTRVLQINGIMAEARRRAAVAGGSEPGTAT